MNRESERKEKEMIEKIFNMEDIFLLNPCRSHAMDLISRWGALRYFRLVRNLPKGMDRIDPLYIFLDTDKLYFRFRRERKKREALDLLKRLRHDD